MKIYLIILIASFSTLATTANAHSGKAVGEYVFNPNQTAEWNLGAKLVQSTFKCAQCHSPRTNPREYKLTSPLSGFHGPNITPHESGIGGCGRFHRTEPVNFINRYHPIS